MQSKLRFRNVYPEVHKEKYEHVQPATSSSDSGLIKGNSKYLSFAWKVGGGGSLAVLELGKPQRLAPVIPLIKGHNAAIQDQDFNPFNDNVIATASDDTTLKVWEIPEEFTQDVTAPLANLQGHSKKVNFVQYHPSTENILASTSNDGTVKVWDVDRQCEALTLTVPDANYWSLCWNSNGSLLGTTSKDKTTRIGDPRAQQWVHELLTHEGSRAQKMTFLGDTGLILSVGFAKTTDREFKVWDIKNLTKPVQHVKIDQQASVLYPFFDSDLGMLYLAGRGDGNIRYYEFADGAFTYTSDHKSTVPMKGIGFIPKRGVNVMRAELMRALKLTDNAIEFISFIQPRKASTFQEDLFPDCCSEIPAQTAEAWLAGNNAAPLRKSMKPDENAINRPSARSVISHGGTADVDRLKRALEEANKEIDSLKTGQAQSEDAEGAKHEIEKLKTELSAIAEEKAALEKKVHAQEEEINELNKKYHEQKTTNSNAEERHELLATVEQLEAEVAELRAHHEPLKRDLELNDAQISSLKQELAQLESEHEALNNKAKAG
eukprot:CAMPEP_0176424438 /NCGR_PEP_ID=MMETSP0127-20121128/10837_1 /TAXON_ID=938130 /ORGANISM="Platyophrya macrostoma, Strain WH" /LENGTH=546 /DNA_ID=CAMNT_0017805495 /DNA_START=29 /DNA_END=1669 /DNA_ORIENTATION=-